MKFSKVIIALAAAAWGVPAAASSAQAAAWGVPAAASSATAAEAGAPPRHAAERELGREAVTVGFYNVENLYDTIPSPFYDDSDYTPRGRNRWDSERYRTKRDNLCRVADAMALDILGLAEVENEAVVRDIVAGAATDYCYIHRTSGDSRGMDLALLYKGDRFIPRSVRQLESGFSRQFLYVCGELCGRRVDIILCHLPSRLNDEALRGRVIAKLHAAVDSLVRNDPRACPVVMGDFNAEPRERIMRNRFGTGRRGPGGALLFSAMEEARRAGRGSYLYRGRWYMYDNIFLSWRLAAGPEFRSRGGEVFVREWMIASGKEAAAGGTPLRSFRAERYEGGFSDHLPVFCVLELW